uniref:TR10B factor n=1 Tax=Anas platyrhynchos TaxID=8839 RepID=A0A8B9R2Q9_ANAPL
FLPPPLPPIGFSPTDQVELSPCSATRNTQCACRNGTFCSPDHPCEMCQKCRTRCPSGQVKIAPCTPHSDLQCGPPTGSISGSSTITIIILIVVALVVGLLLVLLWKWCCRHPAAGEGGGTRGAAPKWGGSEWEGGRALGLTALFFLPGDSRDLGRKSGQLFPCLLPVLRRSFHVFARDVPFKDWKRYGRALDLLENDLALAEMNDKYSQEPFFQMLNTWQNRQGMSASVNTLLEALHRIDLGGIAEDISFLLVVSKPHTGLEGRAGSVVTKENKK